MKEKRRKEERNQAILMSVGLAALLLFTNLCMMYL